MKAQMIEEVWKDIEGFEGFYQISNLGRIKSIAVRRSLWGKIHIINRERLMTPYDNGNGYLMISLRQTRNALQLQSIDLWLLHSWKSLKGMML